MDGNLVGFHFNDTSGTEVYFDPTTKTGYTTKLSSITGLCESIDAFNSCTITKATTITINFSQSINVCTITYDANGGKFTNNTTETKKSYKYKTTNIWENSNPPSMPDANGGYFAATRTSYIPKSGAEWIKSGTTTTYNQSKGYRPIDLCPNIKTKSESVTLKVNWEAVTLTIEPHKIANPKKDGPTASACSGYTNQDYLFIFYLNSNDTIASGKMCYSSSNTTAPTSYCANYSKGVCTNTKAGYAWYKGSNEWFFYRSSSYVYAYAKTTRGKAASKFQG